MKRDLDRIADLLDFLANRLEYVYEENNLLDYLQGAHESANQLRAQQKESEAYHG